MGNQQLMEARYDKESFEALLFPNTVLSFSGTYKPIILAAASPEEYIFSWD